MKRPIEPPAGRIAGIDFGTVRIGIALTDSRQTLASPYEVYNRRNERADAAYFRELVSREQVARFVVGLPVHLHGGESAKSVEARAFGQWLQRVTGVQVDFFDERYTTHQADEFLGTAGLSRKQRKSRRDKLAAQIMLSAYLESRDRGQSAPQALDD